MHWNKFLAFYVRGTLLILIKFTAWTERRERNERRASQIWRIGNICKLEFLYMLIRFDIQVFALFLFLSPFPSSEPTFLEHRVYQVHEVYQVPQDAIGIQMILQVVPS